jgi:hypothetical protein
MFRINKIACVFILASMILAACAPAATQPPPEPTAAPVEPAAHD